MTAGTLWSAENADNAYLEMVADYFDVSYEDVDMVASSGMAIEEVPIVFLMAQHSKKSPTAVLAINTRDPQWSRFMAANDIHPSVVLVDIYRMNTPECKAINEQIKNKCLTDVRFDNNSVIAMVNYRILAETHKAKYADLVEKRDGLQSERASFVDLNQQSSSGVILVDSEEE
jgi:hypothetical protein